MASSISLRPASVAFGGLRGLRQPTGGALVVAAAVWCAVALVQVAVASPSGEHTGRVLYEALLIGVPVAAGLYAIGNLHTARFGVLLVGAGVIWSLTGLAESSESLPYSAGRVVAWLIFPVLIYLMLAFPNGSLAPGLDRTVYRAVTALIAVLYIGSALFVDKYPDHTPWASCSGDACPANAFQLVHPEPAVMANVVRPLRELLGIVLLGAVAYSMSRRVRAATPLQRRVSSPVLVMSIVSIVVLTAYLVTRLSDPQVAAVGTLGWGWGLCIPAIALAFLIGLLRRRLLMGVVLAELGGSLAGEVEDSQLRTALTTALCDPQLEVLLPDATPGRWRDADGRVIPRAAAARAGRAVTLVRDDGVVIAALVHDPTLRDDEELLTAVIGVVYAVLQHRQLTDRLAASLDELEDSRKRVAQAADLERLRIERDLHDGAQQRLISMRIKLSLAEELAVDDPAAGVQAVHELGSQIDLALEDLRSLARGVYPALLSDRGLRDALRNVVAESPLAIHLRVQGLTRHPAEIETAVYFACLEAIQNAVKHAPDATGLWISLRQNHALVMEVRDDGPGFVAPGPNSNGGLGNMRDRLEAVGGRLTIDASPGHGTRIVGSVPLS
jgi:signal transduction histidine kinase